jgi:hypothetical protein
MKKEPISGAEQPTQTAALLMMGKKIIPAGKRP